VKPPRTASTAPGGSLFGYTKLYGHVPGGQAEFLRVPQAQYGPIKVPAGPVDDRFVYLSDVLPTAWQAVRYAGVSEGDSLTVLGLGPIGDMAARIARHLGVRVIAVDLVPERLARARARGIETLDATDHDDDLGDAIRDLTAGRGTDAVIDAVGSEAHGSPAGKLAQTMAGLMPDALAEKLIRKAGVDRLAAPSVVSPRCQSTGSGGVTVCADVRCSRKLSGAARWSASRMSDSARICSAWACGSALPPALCSSGSSWAARRSTRGSS
jgi:threonine dehydrogenase-like Zn-dependent dehydrogenase